MASRSQAALFPPFVTATVVPIVFCNRGYSVVSRGREERAVGDARDGVFPGEGAGQWVLLAYRLPREPSTPRIAVWRRLERLGVAQFCDGLVALPADARTREQLEWIAEQIVESGGTAGVWLARPGTLRQERDLAAVMAAARTAEYAAVLAEAQQAASAGQTERGRAV